MYFVTRFVLLIITSLDSTNGEICEHGYNNTAVSTYTSPTLCQDNCENDCVNFVSQRWYESIDCVPNGGAGSTTCMCCSYSWFTQRGVQSSKNAEYDTIGKCNENYRDVCNTYVSSTASYCSEDKRRYGCFCCS